MMRIALAGAGKVGLALLDLLASGAGGAVVTVAVADSSGSVLAPRGFDPDGLRRIVAAKRGGGRLADARDGSQPTGTASCQFEELFASGIADILVELGPTDIVTGGGSLVRILAALRAGMHVVSASKGPFVALLPDGSSARDAVRSAAEASGVTVRASATVGAGTPMIDTGRIFALGNRVDRIEGSLNGTSSLVLGLMEDGLSLDAALGRARELGMAEADPSADLDGIDAAVKLSILCAEVMDVDLPLGAIARESLREATPERFALAAAHGRKLRAVARAERVGGTGARASVSISEVAPSSPLACSGGDNAVVFSSAHAGEIGLSGRGAGPMETAAAVLRDILVIAGRPHAAS
ncbi:MAG: hypothetical protein NT080_10265 [Spirochaetes bacterium]|nr:hypothetical protein [Spirochaetota bacterium]